MAQDLTPRALGQMPTTSEPFVWGRGGRRMTPEDIERERAVALSLMQPDFSPVQHWTQGLGRVANAALGGLRERRADRASAANAAESDAVAQALMSPAASEVPVSVGGTPAIDPVAAALTNRYIDPSVRKLAMEQFELRNRKPNAPHYWEMNDGSLGVVGPDGQPKVLFKDPTPKINWITADNGDGTKSVIPVGPNGPLNAMPPSGAAPTIIDKLPEGVKPLTEGGPTPSASGGFLR